LDAKECYQPHLGWMRKNIVNQLKGGYKKDRSIFVAFCQNYIFTLNTRNTMK